MSLHPSLLLYYTQSPQSIPQFEYLSCYAISSSFTSPTPLCLDLKPGERPCIGGLPPSNLSVTPPRVQSPSLTNLWEKANETLRNDPDSEKRELAQKYAEILALELAEPEAGPMDTDPAHLKQERVAERLNARVELLSQEQLSISVGSRELHIEPLIRNVSKQIVAARDLISSAAGADPHAALACAGGLVILTVSIGDPDMLAR
ncbi:hypothetical protein CaCOL14_010617 [Colletotrichum acutatum]